jgi:hypothetical protein
LPPGKVPLQVVSSQVERVRAGTAHPGSLLRCVDRHGDELERAILARLAEHHAEFLRAVRRLERIHEHMAGRAAQAAWLRRWPLAGPAPDVQPMTCRLPSGKTIPVPVLLAALHNLADPPLIDKQPSRYRGRPGAGPALAALADAWLTCVDVARELDVDSSAVSRWLSGALPCSPRLGGAIEQLTGDAQLAETIVALIPARNGAEPDIAHQA